METIKLDSLISGQLAWNKCSVGKKGLERGVRSYRVHLTPKQPIKVEISADFDANLTLINPRDKTIAENNGKGNTARIPGSAGSYYAPVEGDCVIKVTAKKPRVIGVFNLTVASVKQDPCKIVSPLQAGVHLTGNLSRTDCQIESAKGAYVDRFSFSAGAGLKVQLLLDAKFDPRLKLISPDGRVLATGTSSIPQRGYLGIPKSNKGDFIVEISSVPMQTGGYEVRLDVKP